jgi:hypothetical protein
MNSTLKRAIPAAFILMTANVQAKNPFENEILAFEAADRASPPPSNAVLFVGSSTIRLWPDVQRDFPDIPTLNRGFGGSSIPDVLLYMDRIVLPYRPRTIVFYGGDNDLANGRTTEQVIRDFEAFASRVRGQLPKAKIVFLAIKPSPPARPRRSTRDSASWRRPTPGSSTWTRSRRCWARTAARGRSSTSRTDST